MRATLFFSLAAAAGALTANVITHGGVESALRALAAAGGGVLYFPPGDHAVRPFNLSSNTIMLLDFATLHAPTEVGAYALVPPLPSYGMGRDKLPNDLFGRFEPLIGIYYATNVTITTNSSGLIDGSGEAFWGPKRGGSLNNTPPHLIEVGWSSRVSIGAPPGSPLHALTLEDSPFWNVHLYDSDDLWVHDVSVFAPVSEANTDAIDPDSSRNVLIERLVYAGGDDGVAIKSGWDDAGILYGVPVENVTVRDSDITTRACCVCVGSEMSGGARNILASNVRCTNTGNAFYVKSAPGRGGFVKNFSFVDSVFTGTHAGLGIMMTVRVLRAAAALAALCPRPRAYALHTPPPHTHTHTHTPPVWRPPASSADLERLQLARARRLCDGARDGRGRAAGGLPQRVAGGGRAGC